MIWLGQSVSQMQSLAANRDYTSIWSAVLLASQTKNISVASSVYPDQGLSLTSVTALCP